MKYAIIADIHANWEGLQTVLADAQANKVTHYACLGDVVGYNANPKECLDVIRKMDMPVVKGNHDEYCSIDSALEGFNPHAAAAVNWTRAQLGEEDILWLRELRYIRLVGNFSIVHATLDGPKRWGYVFDKLAAAASFTYQNTGVCFFGHTHVPVAFVRDATVRGGTYSKFKVEAGKNRRIEHARAAGKRLAEEARQKGIETIVLDRGGYQYHGRVKAFAEGAREGGLKF